MRNAVAKVLATALLFGSTPQLIAATQQGNGSAPKAALAKPSLTSPNVRAETQALVAKTRALATLLDQVATANKDPRLEHFEKSFLRLQALSEVGLLTNHAERVERLAKLGVTARMSGDDLEVKTSSGRRLVKNLGARPNLDTRTKQSPDGGRRDELDDAVAQWDVAQDYAEDAIADIQGMIDEAGSMASDLDSLPALIDAACPAPDGSATAHGPCYDAIKSSVEGILGSIAGYCTNQFNIQTLVNEARTEVSGLWANYNEELIGKGSLVTGIIAACEALVAAVSIPWWASAGIAAAIGFIAYEAWECWRAM